MDCESDTATVVLQPEQTQSNNQDTRSVMLDRCRDGPGGQEGLRERCKDGAGGLLTFINVTTNDRYYTWNPYDLSEEGCQCRCKNIEPDDQCEVISVMIPYAELCVHLNLDPNEEIEDVTTGHPLQIVWPWEAHQDGPDSDPDTYKQYDDYDHTLDPWAYWNEIDGRVNIPIHRLAPKEFRYRGSVLVSAQHDPADAGLTPPDNVDTESPLDEDREYVGTKQNSGLAGDATMSKEHTEGPTDSTEEDDVHDNEKKEDDYEDPRDGDIDSYLRYKIIPFRYKRDFKTRKMWTQNARRRYKLRRSGGADSERRCA